MKNKKWIAMICALAVVIGICFLGRHAQTPPVTDGEPPEASAGNKVVQDPAVDAEDHASVSTRTVEVARPDIMIYTGPGYDYSDTGILLETGACTIAEEETDREGIPWGLLATGEGWIDLQKTAEEAPHIPLTMELDCNGKLAGREYHEHILTESEYVQRLLFRAYEPLTNVRVTMMDITVDEVVSGDPLYTLDALTTDKPLVIGVVFFGDLTTYGLSFTDASGAEHHYMLYTSGRNGSVVMQPYTPNKK